MDTANYRLGVATLTIVVGVGCATNAVDRGLVQLARGDYAGAVAECRAALDRHGADERRAYVCLGTAYNRLGMASAAIPALVAALRLDDEDAGVHFELGVALHSIRHYNEATIEYQSAIRADPTRVDAYYFMARVFVDTVHVDQAVGWLRLYLRLARGVPTENERVNSAERELARLNEGQAAD